MKFNSLVDKLNKYLKKILSGRYLHESNAAKEARENYEPKKLFVEALALSYV